VTLELSDAEVVQRVLAGDADAYAILVDRYWDRYARYAVRMVGNREDAEEALQDAFVRAYRALGRYQEQEKFGGWLLRIVVNECRTVAARGRRREQRFPDCDEAAWLAAEAAAATDHPAEVAALREELERALAALPREQREALLLKYGEELSYDEIAAVTGAGTSALKMRVKRACERLREILLGAACA
jgi:RNA polymerase sigma-70 factor (ECF subfamily)